MPRIEQKPKVKEVITDVQNVEVYGRGQWLPVLRTIGSEDGKVHIEVYEGEQGMRVFWNSFSQGPTSRYYLYWQWRRMNTHSPK